MAKVGGGPGAGVTVVCHAMQVARSCEVSRRLQRLDIGRAYVHRAAYVTGSGAPCVARRADPCADVCGARRTTPTPA